MATLKTVVLEQRDDGFYAVYKRIVHRSRMGDQDRQGISPKIVTASGELKDPVVNEYYGLMILKYTDEPNGFGGIDEVARKARVMRLTRLCSLS